MKLTDQQRAERKALAAKMLDCVPHLQKHNADWFQHAAACCGLGAEGIQALLADLEGAELATGTLYDNARIEIARLQDELAATRQQLSTVQNAYAEAAYADWSKHESALVVQLRQQLAEAQARSDATVKAFADWQNSLHMNSRTHSNFVELHQAFLVAISLQASGGTSALQSAIEQAVAPYKRDAERYRALRNGSAICAPAVKPIGRIAVGIPHQPTTENERKALDESIDAALSAKEKSNG